MNAVQLGEVKKGLKAYKASGATTEDYQRHIMFVQVCSSLRPHMCPAMSFLDPRKSCSADAALTSGAELILRAEWLWALQFHQQAVAGHVRCPICVLLHAGLHVRGPGSGYHARRQIHLDHRHEG